MLSLYPSIRSNRLYCDRHHIRSLEREDQTNLCSNSITHVYDIAKIEDIDGNEVTDRFELLDGQKPDAFYHSSIRLISGATLSRSGTDDFALGSVSYRYFEHAGVDKPITVDSYPSTIDIESIPRFTDPESGIDFSLANAVDFRPVELNTSSRRNQGSTHGFLNVGSLPDPFDVVGNYQI